MEEVCEFRFAVGHEPSLFSAIKPELIGKHVLKYRLNTSDPLYRDIWRLDRERLKEINKPVIGYWNISRIYEKSELEQSKFLSCNFSSKSHFEPVGTDHGTIYYEPPECSSCGSGVKQLSLLRLPQSKIPKSVDCAVTITEIERLFSVRFLESLAASGISGIRSQPIERVTKVRKSSQTIDNWRQIFAEEPFVELSWQTVVGYLPFDSEGIVLVRCECGRYCGPNILSEIYIEKADIPKNDFTMTRCFFGQRRGVVQPRQKVIVSQRFYQIFKEGNFKGLEFEVVRIV